MINQIYGSINDEINNIDISDEINIFKELAPNISDYMLISPYYKALAAYCKLYKPQNVLEIGTCSGASAAVMKKYCDNILTVDIDLTKVINKIELDKLGINFKQIGKSDVFDLEFEKFDFIFIDVDHNGVTEILLHNKLIKTYSGIVFYDDIYLNQNMKLFWDSIKQPKLDTNWHVSGFGIVNY